jgi:putative sigma-54 modulation protein
MNIRLITRHLDRTQALVTHTQERASFALARFKSAIRDIDIRRSDINGPRGGTDLAGLARLRLVGGGDIIVKIKANSPESGISTLITRMSQTLRRTINRRQDH